MAQFIYYRDEEKETGPVDEKTVLELYNGAEFTSDVSFQIRSSETDSAAPFITLRELISKNGPSNPFCGEFADVDKRIGEAEKKLAELREMARKGEDLEKTVVEIEKHLESLKESETGASCSGVTTEDNVHSFSDMVRSLNAMGVQPFLHTTHHARKLGCDKNESCANVSRVDCYFNSTRVLHSHFNCPSGLASELAECRPDYARWDKDDNGRRSMGIRLFSAMTPDQQGSARPSPDFIEEINDRLKKDMKLSTDAGRKRAMQYMQSSDAAKKMRDRFEKHLREAKGMLVCRECKVACRSHGHFIIHLTTYKHRLKVVGTSLELISLVIGWFRRELYLNEVDPSELDENIESNPVSILDSKMDALRVSTSEGDVTDSMELREETQSSGEQCPLSDGCNNEERGLGPLEYLMKQQLLREFAERTIISCTECNAMYTNCQQFLVHIGSEQHVANVGKVKQSRQEAEEDQKGHVQMLRMFDSDLQKWRWSDRAQLAGGKKMCGEWSEEQKKTETRPKEEFMEQLNRQLKRTIQKKPNGRYDEYFLVAERYFVSSEAKELMDGVEKHLKEGKLFMCAPCKFGCRDSKSFFVHCMTYDHVRATQGSIYELPTVLIGVHKKHLYV